MNSDFPRILTLLRKEKGISQKEAASHLGISQALLSHYEKGIRECGLDFLVRCGDFYGVSSDYLLGRSPERSGSKITVEDIPEPDAAGKENAFAGGILPVLNKKLIANSLNILFDLLSRVGNDKLVTEVSSFLMLSVYRMFRVVYGINPKNQASMFTIPETLAKNYAAAVMQISEANAAEAALEQPAAASDKLYISTETLAKDYPLFSTSLLNLISSSEKFIGAGCNLRQ